MGTKQEPKESAGLSENQESSQPRAHFFSDLSEGERNELARKIYEKYAGPIRAVARSELGRDLSPRLEPDDIVQSTFRSFFRRAAKGCYDVPSEKELWSLLLVIAVNKARRQGVYHRAAKRDVRRTVPVETDQARRRDQEVVSELSATIGEVLSTLSPKEQEIVNLRMQGFQINEIHEQVQRSKRTVERVLQSFRETLTALIEEKEDDEPIAKRDTIS